MVQDLSVWFSSKTSTMHTVSEWLPALTWFSLQSRQIIYIRIISVHVMRLISQTRKRFWQYLLWSVTIDTIEVSVWQYTNVCIYQNLQSRFAIERHPHTKSRIGQIPCVCMYVCVCNYSSQPTEPIYIKIIPADRASDADCYRLLRLEIFTPIIFKTPKKERE